jgi:hypothetical protein
MGACRRALAGVAHPVRTKIIYGHTVRPHLYIYPVGLELELVMCPLGAQSLLSPTLKRHLLNESWMIGLRVPPIISSSLIARVPDSRVLRVLTPPYIRSAAAVCRKTARAAQIKISLI